MLLALAAVPILIKESRPLAKWFGEGLRKLGEKIVESATPEPVPVAQAETKAQAQEVPKVKRARSSKATPARKSSVQSKKPELNS